ncbi:pentapeptide repeat-containing protein [Micromonospora sp. GCM10011542]|uniref:pentapeptide repeat-containing protein n=1 Tax=Micromonospora sp. GCM10011542 TaxID=3317337 RepID=UPI003608CE2F
MGDFLDFRGADFSRLDLTGAYLANSDLAGVRFEEANLGDANLNNAHLQGADFFRCGSGQGGNGRLLCPECTLPCGAAVCGAA